MIPRTDAGNAEQLVTEHGDDTRYVVPDGYWITWDDEAGHWRRDDDGEMRRRALITARRRVLLTLDLGGDELKHALASESDRRLRATVDLAAVDERVIVRADQLDADPFLLGPRNGTLDLRKGEVRAARREDLITRTVPVEFDLDATCPTWQRFLADVFPGQADVIDWLQRFVGYCLTGDTSEHIVVILHGAGCNGKSVLLGVLHDLLGPFSQTTPFDTFIARRDRGPRDDLARTRGARLLTASESSGGLRLDEAAVKELSGGDTIAARPLYGAYVEFKPTAKTILTTNHLPTVDGDDDAIWRRLRLISFDVSFEGREDRSLARKLRAELPGILTWAVEGCVQWQQDGLTAPLAIVRATKTYRQNEDTIGAFIDTCCVLGDLEQVSTTLLWDAYGRYSLNEGEKLVSRKEFKRGLERRGIVDARTKSQRLYRGIGLNGDAMTRGDANSGSSLHAPARRGVTETVSSRVTRHPDTPFKLIVNGKAAA